MKISTRGRYGLRAVIDLAMHEEQGCVPLGDIALRQDLSLNYLEGIFSYLKRAGIVIGMAGAQGGYRLAKRPEELSIWELMHVLEGSMSVSDPLTQDSPPLSIGMLPHRIFRTVVFPEPLLPTTETNCPFLIPRLKSRNSTTSFTEFGLKVLISSGEKS